MRKSFSYNVLIVVASCVVVADQLTKYWILTNFSLYETRTVIPGFFNLVNIRNTGAAFGLFAGNESEWRTLFFGIIALVAVFAIIFLFKHYRQKGSLYVYALSSIAGGAIGNVIDRVRFGAVVDFLDFYVGQYHWPAFNVADSAIVVGVGLFLIGNFVHPEMDQSSEEN